MDRFLALLLFVPSLCLAQIPGCLPNDSLVTWFPFDGDALDASGNDNDGVIYGAVPADDRLGNAGGSLEFTVNGSGGWGAAQDRVVVSNPPISNANAFTMVSWIYLEEKPAPFDNRPHTIMGRWSGNGQSVFRVFALYDGTLSTRVYGSGDLDLGSIPYQQWTHVGSTFDGQYIRHYINGVLAGSLDLGPDAQLPISSSDLTIGELHMSNGHWYLFSGRLEDVGYYDRALSDEEVLCIASGATPISGCTDFTACNYDSSATADNGSCEYGCLYCGEGTAWDSTLQLCVGVVPPADSILVPIPSCGEGTVWDPVNEECIIAIPADLNYDGCVTVADLLELLAVHGTCPPYPEWPDEPTDTTWTCGDPLTYWDYDYSTVLIGDQCWFAENLRSATYANGDSIGVAPGSSDWNTATIGLTAVYGDGSWYCDSEGLLAGFDPCDSDSSLQYYGRMYNFFTIQDSRSVCPIGWHVPTDSEWMELETEIGVPEDELETFDWRGSIQNAGTKLKASIQDSLPWNGTNESGFTAVHGGFKTRLDGRYFSAGVNIKIWTSSGSNGGARIHRVLNTSYSGIRRFADSQHHGFYIRCIKD